jgi:hypothetical protein
LFWSRLKFQAALLRQAKAETASEAIATIPEPIASVAL